METLHNRDRQHLVQLMEALYLMDAFTEHGGMACECLESYKTMKHAMEVYLCDRGMLNKEPEDDEGIVLYTFMAETEDAEFNEFLERANPWYGEGYDELTEQEECDSMGIH